MAVAAIDAVVRHVMFVTEGQRLIDRTADVSGISRAHVELDNHEQEHNPEQRAPEREPGHAVCSWAEDLSHRALSALWEPAGRLVLISITNARRPGLRPARRGVSAELLEQFFEHVPDHDRLVVVLVTGAVDKRDVALARRREQGRQHVAAGVELAAVATLELSPALGIMPEPGAQLVARPDLLEPGLDVRRVLADAARPDAIDQEAAAIFGFCRCIHPFELDHQSAY